MDAEKLVKALHGRAASVFWAGFTELTRRYFRVEIEGLEHVPRKGPAILIANHSGFAGADAIMLSHLLTKKLGRMPLILAHRAFFDWSQAIRRIAESFGLRRASKRRGLQVLHDGNLLLIFPEGEEGNFKPSRHRYELQPFRTGFLRLALEENVPVIPCLVIGAEETHFNLGRVDLSRWVRHLILPLPANLIPLPAKWKILFLDPLKISVPKGGPKDKVFVYKTVDRIQRELQRRLNEEIARRPYVYFPVPEKFKRKFLSLTHLS